ncbi:MULTISPECIES: AtuA-related protein [Parachlamydia]|jgi:hypothetical protein|uniref:AtuA-like ferredoxin-fold domain-containing protein n=2 Tax=Parachlamydia acanthamoebae TaxID=83552 RepID=F8KVS8_PARAV|nr:hypothetical protein [Parachlamydia acanthamoebae]EFB42168.1 hypothetical protein pah_c014o094 [Parachlamydia acanthamoebae str. Hall's coccus]KIA76330.1 hypothetical protein DB43_AL00130 [Parachlamydia acanthamoebae]CCB85214.1 putative uncharacterized protein [Parachlamydia acanthamoebae UV-7]
MHKLIHLYDIAHARSGDKGSDSNIGVIAYTSEGYQFLVEILTSEKVLQFMQKTQVKSVIRYEWPNLGALNFVLKGALGKGASRSLRIDAQGKALGQILLEMPLEIDENRLTKCLAS